uniref:Transposon protein n=1 Tax=Arundo donax TaxID=35708 RepID=A0A0A9HPQ6_ARUDO
MQDQTLAPPLRPRHCQMNCTSNWEGTP